MNVTTITTGPTTAISLLLAAPVGVADAEAEPNAEADEDGVDVVVLDSFLTKHGSQVSSASENRASASGRFDVSLPAKSVV